MDDEAKGEGPMGEGQPEQPAVGGALEPVAEGTGTVDALAAALRRDAADLEVYGQVLSGSLAEALPPGSVVLERKRGMADRLAGRDGRVERVEISLDDQRLILSLAHGRPAAEVAKVVRGVVLSRTPVPLDEWLRKLAAAMALRARSDARARAVLEKLVLGGSTAP
jgi:hypothetical protein